MSNQYKAHERYIWTLTGVSGADTITANANTTFKQYLRGMTIIWEAASNNTGAVTININGAGAVMLKKNGHSTALAADDLVAGVSYVAVHDGTNFQIVSGALTGGGGGGSVTSVGLAKTNDDTVAVSGTPVTSAGTLSLDAVDAGAADALVGWDDSAGKKVYFALGTGLSTTGTTLNVTGGTGTVTSVAQTVPVEFAIAGSPITTSGTLAITKATQSANLVWAGPTSGAAAQPTFRALVAADVPTIVPVTGPEHFNSICNGAFNIWQRGTSFLSPSDTRRIADRWMYRCAGGQNHNISRSTEVPTFALAGRLFNYSLKLECNTADAAMGAGEYTALTHRVEGFDWTPLAQRACILSFWIRSSKTGTYCIGLTNSTQDRAFVQEYTISAANIWEYKTIALSASPSAGTWNYTTGIGLSLTFAFAAGTGVQTATVGSWFDSASVLKYATANQVNFSDSNTAVAHLTGVQLQTGNQATEYQHTSFGWERVRCQRYYENSFQIDVTPASSVGLNGATYGVQAIGASATQALAIALRWQTRKRTAGPTMSLYNPSAAGVEIRNVTAAQNCTGTAVQGTNDLGAWIETITTAGSAAGNHLAIHWECEDDL